MESSKWRPLHVFFHVACWVDLTEPEQSPHSMTSVNPDMMRQSCCSWCFPSNTANPSACTLKKKKCFFCSVCLVSDNLNSVEVGLSASQRIYEKCNFSWISKELGTQNRNFLAQVIKKWPVISQHKCKTEGQELFLFTTQSGGWKESSLWIQRDLVFWRIQLLRPGLSSAFHTVTEAQKLCFWLVNLPPGETKATENFFFLCFVLFLTKNIRKCVLEKTVQKNCGFSSPWPHHRVHHYQSWINPAGQANYQDSQLLLPTFPYSRSGHKSGGCQESLKMFHQWKAYNSNRMVQTPITPPRMSESRRFLRLIRWIRLFTAGKRSLGNR